MQKEVPMYVFALSAIAVGFFSFSGNAAYSSQTDQPSVLLVQGGTGAGSGSQGLETGKSGTGKETDAGRGTMGKKSPFGGDQPTSGDFSPNPSDATRSGSKPEDVDKTITGSEQPSGIGEKGSGQTRSTQERSGGQQPGASESMSKSAEKHGEGKTEKAMKDLQSQKPKNK
jgi:hypothetical protein